MLEENTESREGYFKKGETCNVFIRGDQAKIKKYIKELGKGERKKMGGKKHVLKDGVKNTCRGQHKNNDVISTETL